MAPFPASDGEASAARGAQQAAAELGLEIGVPGDAQLLCDLVEKSDERALVEPAVALELVQPRADETTQVRRSRRRLGGEQP